MKFSNLVLTFILAVIASFPTHAQSNTVREISIDSDEEVIYIKYENGDLIELNIDGEAIPKRDFSKYGTLLDRFTKNEPTPPTTPNNVDLELGNEDADMGSILNEKLTRYLVDADVMNANKYKFKLTPKYIKVNGNKLDKQIHSNCLAIFEQTAGHELSTGSKFKVKITSNSKSITLSIED